VRGRLAALLIGLALLLAPVAPRADESPASVDAYLFWALGCPHCERALAFLERLEREVPRLRVHRLEVTRDTRNRDAFLEIVQRARIADPGVPLAVVGDRVVEGYLDDASTGADLRALVLACAAAGCPDVVAPRARCPRRCGCRCSGRSRCATCRCPR
jgi:hypothetical protein